MRRNSPSACLLWNVTQLPLPFVKLRCLGMVCGLPNKEQQSFLVFNQYGESFGRIHEVSVGSHGRGATAFRYLSQYDGISPR
jgi:hypothetical protein